MSDSQSTQAKLIGFRSSLVTVVEQLNMIDEEVFILLDPNDVEGDVLDSMKILEPTYGIQAELILRVDRVNIIS